MCILPGDNVDVTEDFDVSTLPKETIRVMEADSFWCMSKLLDGIQDNYTFAQPGIQLKVNQLKELIQRIDSKLDLPKSLCGYCIPNSSKL